MAEIYFVRHGQASFGAQDYDKLSAIGHKQTQLLGLMFKEIGLEFDKVVCGAMVRHKESLKQIKLNLHLPETIFDKRLNELDYQRLESSFCSASNCSPPSSPTEFRDFFPKLISAWASDQLNGLEESYLEFNDRINSAVNDHIFNSERVLIVSSGGPTSLLVTRALDLNHLGTGEILYFTMNSSYSVFSELNDRFTLLQFNCTPHLDKKEYNKLKTFI
jgi:broad specificity phosphatase PhoE